MLEYMSKDARKVVNHLGRFGIEIDIGEEIFQIDVACSMYFPNHIISVIDQVLGGKNKVKKLFKAQEDGWYYFAAPIVSMLKGRTTAWQPACPDEDDLFGWSPEQAAAAYILVCSSMIPHDMNRTEANQLLYDCPRLGGRDEFIEAIHICKERNARSIPYLHGILERKSAQIQAFIKERDARDVGVWIPDVAGDTIQSDEATSRWESFKHTIKSIKSLNEAPRRRRRP